MLRWSLEVEDMSKHVPRVWINGSENTLGDAPARNPEDCDRDRDSPAPAGPVTRVLTAMFERPVELEEECRRLRRFLSALAADDPDKEKAGWGSRPRQPVVPGRKLGTASDSPSEGGAWGYRSHDRGDPARPWRSTRHRIRTRG